MSYRSYRFRPRTRIWMQLMLFIMLFHPIYGRTQGTQQENGTTRILFVFDASQSMLGYWESAQKITIARNLLIDIIDSLSHQENIQMALRVYGHQSPVPPQDCKDTKLEIPFDKNNAEKIKQKLRYLRPKGTTPIAYSLAQSAYDFPPCKDCRNIVILITDGEEECGGDPCEVSLDLQNRGITLKSFIIGIGMDPGFRESFDCIGFYYDAVDEERFKEVLGVVISQVLNPTTAQVNLLDTRGQPNETNVNMTFYDRFSGNIRHNYVHTINHRGNPDTLLLDPLLTYRLVVHTIPSVQVDSFSVTPGRHTIVAADAPMGSLVVKSSAPQYRDIRFSVRDSRTNEALHYQKINHSERYLVGNYTVEIPILPTMVLKNVEIKQSHTTTIELPRPGIVTFRAFSRGYGSLYVERNGEMELIYNFDPGERSETVLLQPGKYRSVFRTKGSKNTLTTVTRTFKVESGSSQQMNLQ